MVHFGELLRDWRTRRGYAQLKLAHVADFSQRHISFLESGRSQPSRSTVIRLSEALNIPMAERNALLQSAGFAPLYSRAPIEQLTAGLDLFAELLQGHRPFPAIIIDRAWNMYAGNLNAILFFQSLMAEPTDLPAGKPMNVLELCLSNKGFRPYMENWPQFANNILAYLKREYETDPGNPTLAVLINEFAHDAGRVETEPGVTDLPFNTLNFERDGHRYSLFSLLSQVASPTDIHLGELRLETFLPADEATRAALLALDADIAADQSVVWLQNEGGLNLAEGGSEVA